MARAKSTEAQDSAADARVTRRRKVKQVFQLDGGVEVTIAFFPDNRPRWNSTQDQVNIASPGVEMGSVSHGTRPVQYVNADEIPQERPGTDEKIKRVLRSGGRDFLKAAGYEEEREAKVNPNRALLEAAGLPTQMLDPDYLSGLPGAEGVSGGTDDEN